VRLSLTFTHNSKPIQYALIDCHSRPPGGGLFALLSNEVYFNLTSRRRGAYLSGRAMTESAHLECTDRVGASASWRTPKKRL